MQFENQKMLESFFNERQTPKLIRKEMLASPTVVATIQASGLDEDFALDFLGHLVLSKRAAIPSLVGLLKHHFKDSSQPYQKTADAIVQACTADLADYDPVKHQVIVRFDLDSTSHELIRQYQYLPPMTVPPLKVTSNRGSGYITVRTDSLILKNNHHEGELCLDSINRFNNVALSINSEVATRVRNQWKNIDKPKADETFEEYQKRVKAFNKYQKDTAFTMALLIEMGNRFYLTHKVDKRGRTYAQGYHCQYQGNDWSKATIALADPELIEE